MLLAWNEGDAQALDQLMPLVHDELHLLAHRYMAGERDGHPLQTTALVNEVYLRLVDVKNVDWQQRAQFFAIAAQMMRRILVDAANPFPDPRAMARHRAAVSRRARTPGRSTRGLPGRRVRR